MTTDTVGGVWTFTTELASELLARGFVVALVAVGRAPSQEQRSWLADITVSFPNFLFVTSEAPLEWMLENATAYSAAEPLLLDLCESFQPDALLLSQLCFGALPVAAPKLLIAHSDVLSWAAAVGKAPLADDAWLRTYTSLVQRGLAGGDAVVAPTRAMLDDLQIHFAVPAHAGVIPNGRSLPISKRTSTRKLQAVTAGRMWDEAKNLKLLSECVSPMPLLIAGESEIIEANDGSVRMLGKLSEADLLALFRESALYICGSVYEPFGLAPLEAALCGCAVIANDIPSLREVWGDAALYFSGAASLSRMLARLSASTAELTTAQARSHARALTYTSGRMAKQYMQQIDLLITSAPRSEAYAA